MSSRCLFLAAGRFSVGNAGLVRSFSLALAQRVPRTAFVESGDPAQAHAVLVAVAPTPSDLARGRVALSSLGGLVSSSNVHVVLWHAGIPGGVSTDDARSSLGRIDHVWPFDPDASLTAEANASTIVEVRPRSRLVRAVEASADRVAPLLERPVEPEALNPAAVAAAVSQRVWRRLERASGDGRSIETEIEAELNAFLRESTGRLGAEGLEETRRRLRHEILGLGPLETFLSDPEVSEVMVNGAGAIFVERAGRMERASAQFAGDERLRLVIARIVSPAGRRVDLASPLCDVRLSDGSRANVVLPPVAVDGPLLTIRRFRPAFSTLDDWVRSGSLSSVDAGRLQEAVTERKNIVVAGNSGAGKTTLLNAMAAFIPDEERILTLEDAAELRIAKPHVVRLETRPANAEGRGEVAMRDLVINALRMRPDRLVVGECRGAEAIPMLQAMNTGHDGSLTTLHANSAADVLQRLEAMVLIGAPQWPPDVVRRQIRSAIHVVAYLRRTGGRRRLESLGPLPEAAL